MLMLLLSTADPIPFLPNELLRDRVPVPGRSPGHH